MPEFLCGFHAEEDLSSVATLVEWQDHHSEEVWGIAEVNDWIEEELERRYR